MKHVAGSVVGTGVILAIASLAAWLPASAACAADAAPIPGYVAVPLSRTENYLMISATVNGREVPLVLDTGASCTVLSESAYKRSAGQSGRANPGAPGSRDRPYTINGQKARIGQVQSLRAGGMDFGPTPVAVTDLSSVRREASVRGHDFFNMEGFLGADLLVKYGAILDGARQVVYFNTDPARRARLGPLLVKSGWTPVAMARTSHGHFSVPTEVNGKNYQLVVDTGACTTSVAAQRFEGSDVHGKSTRVFMQFINTEAVEEKALVLKDWRIGGYTIKSFPVGFSKLPMAVLNDRAPGGEPTLGLLGAEVLLIHHAIIDFGGMKLYLHPY